MSKQIGLPTDLKSRRLREASVASNLVPTGEEESPLSQETAETLLAAAPEKVILSDGSVLEKPAATGVADETTPAGGLQRKTKVEKKQLNTTIEKDTYDRMYDFLDAEKYAVTDFVNYAIKLALQELGASNNDAAT